ncbi:peptidoglycan bridge formation glycyltransferase FemA/FemB family protein, partial [bacterium]|nr:peptidoglycan bridge formation glycyltransferase FemA/FemB family protein [bacterium]
METFIVKDNFEKYDNLAKDSFLQSKTWAEFKNKSSWEPVRIVVEENKKPVFMIQILKRSLPLGYSLLYAPYSYFDKKYEKQILGKIKEIAE